MKTIKYLTRQYGEFHSTPRSIVEPYNELNHKDINFEDMSDTILSNDDWRPYPKKTWGIQELSIPEWMNPTDYEPIKFRYYLKIGGSELLGKKVYEKITSIEDGGLRLACIKLLKTKKFKNKLRENLKAKLILWINDDTEFDTPFSFKQTNVLVNRYIIQEAKCLGVSA